MTEDLQNRTHISDAAQMYVGWQRDTQKLAKGTWTGTRSTLSLLEDYLLATGVAYADQLNRKLMEAFMTDQWGPGSDSTWNHRRHTLMAFCEYLLVNRMLGDDSTPCALIPRRTEKRTQAKEGITRGELALIKKSAKHPRDYYLVAISWKMMRRGPSEIGPLRISSYNPTVRPDCPYGVITYVSQKSGKGPQAWKVDAELHGYITEWLAFYLKETGAKALSPQWYLFPALRQNGRDIHGTERAMRLNPTSRMSDMSRKYAEIFKRCGIYVRGQASHRARRGGARDLKDRLEEGLHPNPIGVIQQLLDHSDEKTSWLYLDENKARNDAMAAMVALGEPATMQKAPTSADLERRADEILSAHPEGPAAKDLAPVVGIFSRRSSA